MNNIIHSNVKKLSDDVPLASIDYSGKDITLQGGHVDTKTVFINGSLTSTNQIRFLTTERYDTNNIINNTTTVSGSIKTNVTLNNFPITEVGVLQTISGANYTTLRATLTKYNLEWCFLL